MIRQLSPVLLAALIVTGCGSKPIPDDSRPVGPLTTPALVRQWRADLDLVDDPITSVHVREDAVVAYTRTARSYVLNRSAGDVEGVARVRVSGSLQPPVIIPDGVAYPSGTHLEVHTRQGKLLRSIDLRRPIRSGAVADRSNVYLGTAADGRGRMQAIDTTVDYGGINEVMTMGAIEAAPATALDRVYFGSTDGAVYASSQADLGPVWSLPGGTFQTGGPIVADLAADASGVYVASSDSKLYALNPDGQVMWTYFAGTPLRNRPDVTAKRVYIAVPDKGLVAIDKQIASDNPPARGTPRDPAWSYGPGRQFLAETAEFVMVRTEGNRIDVLDRKTGQKKFSSVRNDLVAFGTNIYDGTVYAATASGQVLAIKPVTEAGTIGEQVRLEVFQPLAAAN